MAAPQMPDVAFDITPLIEKGQRQINESLEAHSKWLLLRAYVAGADTAYEDTCGCISDPKERGFEEWFAAFVAEVNP